MGPDLWDFFLIRTKMKHQKKGNWEGYIGYEIGYVMLVVIVSLFFGDVHSDPWDDPVFDGNIVFLLHGFNEYRKMHGKPRGKQRRRREHGV